MAATPPTLYSHPSPPGSHPVVTERSHAPPLWWLRPPHTALPGQDARVGIQWCRTWTLDTGRVLARRLAPLATPADSVSTSYLGAQLSVTLMTAVGVTWGQGQSGLPGAAAQSRGLCLGVRPAAPGGWVLGRQRSWTPRSQSLVSGHQTDDPCPPANVPRVGQDAVFPFWGRLSQIRMRKTCLAMSDEEIFHECWFGGRGNFRFQANYCDRSVPGGSPWKARPGCPGWPAPRATASTSHKSSP